MNFYKGCLIPLVVIAVLVGVYYVSGLQTEYYYADLNSGRENIALVNDKNFKLTFGLSSDKKTKESSAEELSVGLIFTEVNSDVEIEKANIKVSDTTRKSFALDSIYAVDGFYSWKEEMNSKAKAFNMLPEAFKTVSKNIEAYFVYGWHFRTNGVNADRIQVTINTTLESNKKTYRIEKAFSFELKYRVFFRSPIRAH